jgi:hypothetical protein
MSKTQDLRKFQTKWQSLGEQIATQLFMFIATVITAQLFVYEMFGVDIDLMQNFGVGVYFTFQAIIFRYFLRRFFENRHSVVKE